MPRGGKRPNAGRKAGAITKKHRALAEQIAKTAPTTETVATTGKSMLEIMIGNAQHFAKVAADAEAALEGLTAENITGLELEPAEQFKVLLAEVKKAAGLRLMAQSCAKDAAPFLHPHLSSIEGKAAGADDEVPLVERLKAYARADAISDSAGKVVELPKKHGKR